MAIGHTDGSTAGFGSFGLPNEFYGGIVGNFTAIIGSSTTTSNVSRDLNQGRYNDILVPCKAVDDKVLDDYLNPMNTKKQSIKLI